MRYHPHRGFGWGHRHRHHGHGLFAFGRRFFGPGEVRLALLSLLATTPRHGYELMKELEARSGGTYRASAGTIYPTLQQLEDEGLVASGERDGKRVYRLTAEGRRELEREEETVRRIWRRADEWHGWSHATAPEASEVIGPALRVLRAALRAACDERADAQRTARVREILERAAEEIRRLAARA
jgi:DNA-binding PadR family transcriptional regulator